MTARHFVLLWAAALSMFPIRASAEFYRFKDAQGVMRYTDNLAEVPEDQRPQVTTYQEVRTATPAVETDGARQEDAAPPDNAPIETFAADPATLERLDATKKALDQEYADLMDSKQKLLKEKEEKLKGLAARDVNARKDYEDRVKALNDRIQDYEKRREAFVQESNALNKSVEEAGPAQ
jgi:chromosome segregation ATPase